MKRIIEIVFMIFIGSNLCWSQGTDFQYNSRKIFVSFSLLPAQTSILNKGVYNAAFLKNTPDVKVSGTIEFGYMVSKKLSFCSGIGINSYSTALGMSQYENSYDSIDSENDIFEMQIVGTGIVEKQEVTSLSIPVKIQYQTFFTKKFGLFLNSGIMFDFPIKLKYTASGIFDYNGYYPEYNITLYNLPEYGFPENVSLKKSGPLDLTKFNFNYIASAGVLVKVNSSVHLSFGFYFNHSIGSISNYSPLDFQLTKKSDDFNSIMSSTSDVRLRAMGTNFSVIFNL